MNRVLVLNADFQPLNVTSFKRGFNLVFNGKAVVVEEVSNDSVVSTTGKKYKRPLVIRLIRFIYIPFKRVPLSKYNIFRRDGHVCGYCGSKIQLTIDHVIPKSRGGSNDWTNLVTCCRKCNAYKDDKTPKEANMTLNVKLYRPTFQQFINNMNPSSGNTWSNYFN